MGTGAGALRRSARGWLMFAVAIVAAGAERARAAGVEDTVTGTVALGRAANYARVNDFMAVWQNPANLAIVPRSELGLELRLPFFDACFDREPDPAISAAGGYLATESFEEVCNKAGVTPAGSLGFATSLPAGFGFGVGLFTPGGTANGKFGHTRINTVGTSQDAEPLPLTTGQVESPNRFLLVDKEVVAAYLMAGVGYQPIPLLRVGLSVGIGFIDIGFSNVTSLLGGTFADAQVVSKMQVADAFVPRATLSVASTPLDSVDLMASLTWTDDIKADGTLEVRANGFNTAPRRDCSEAIPGPHCRVDDVSLEVPSQRLEAVIGARYAQRKKPRDRALDPMRDEAWDVELDAYWVQTSHVDSYTLNIHDGSPVNSVSLSSSPDAPANPLPTQAKIFHGWRDTYGVRLGGDAQLLPERLSVRAGVAYETSGVPPRNMNIDYWPVQKLALSLGATVAVGRFRLSVAYVHVFNETVEVEPGQGRVTEIVARSPQLAQAANEGKFRSSLDVLSFQANVSF